MRKAKKHRRPAIIPTLKAKKRWQVVQIRTQRAIIQKQQKVILTQKEIAQNLMAFPLTQRVQILWQKAIIAMQKGMGGQRPEIIHMSRG